jgi:hypothetical protein
MTIASTGTLTNSGNITIASIGTLTNGGTITNNSGATLTNSGTITSTGTVTNSGPMTNNIGATVTNSGSIANNTGATLTNRGAITNTSTSALTNTGSITNSGTLTGDNVTTYTNTGTNTNTGTFVITISISRYVAFDTPNTCYTVSSNVTIPRFATITNINNIFISSGATFTNNGRIDNEPYYITNRGTFVNTSFGTLLAKNTIYNTGTLTNNGILTNTTQIYNSYGGTITNNGTYSGSGGQIFNGDGSGACGTGTLNGTSPLTATGNTCQPPIPPPPILGNPNLSGNSFTNSASITVNQTGGTAFQWNYVEPLSDIRVTMPNGSYSTGNFTITVSGATTSTLNITINRVTNSPTNTFQVFCAISNLEGSVETTVASITKS